MLKSILSPSDCAKCRICCEFDRNDIWEMPTVSDELKECILEKNTGTEFDGHTFRADFKEGEELVRCPMLTENGCGLGEDKPFDCKIWPFRIMQINEHLLGITVSPVCPKVFSLPLDRLYALLDGEGLADKIFEYADSHRYIIKPYIADYPILMLKNTYAR